MADSDIIDYDYARPERLVYVDKAGMIAVKVGGLYTFHWQGNYYFCFGKSFNSFIYIEEYKAYSWTDTYRWELNTGYDCERAIFFGGVDPEYIFTEDLTSVVRYYAEKYNFYARDMEVPDDLKNQFIAFLVETFGVQR